MRPLILALLLASSAQADDIDRFTKLGDVLELALPIAAGVCAYRQDRGPEFVAGLVVNQAVVNGLKGGLGHSSVNLRPDGNYEGFPSGHMAAATYGATSLARKCYADRPGLKVVTYGLAALVGLSRIAADRNDVWQVGAGAVVGYFANGITFSSGPGSIGIGYSLKF